MDSARMIASLLVSSAYRNFLVIPRASLYLVATLYAVLLDLVPLRSKASGALRTTAGYIVWALVASDLAAILSDMVPAPLMQERLALCLMVAAVSLVPFLEPVMYALVLQVTDIAVGVRGGNTPFAFLSGINGALFITAIAWLWWAPVALRAGRFRVLWDYSHVGARLMVVRVVIGALTLDGLDWTAWLCALLASTYITVIVAPDSVLLDSILQDVTLLLAQQRLRNETLLAWSPVTVVAFVWWAWWQDHAIWVYASRPYIDVIGRRLASVALFLWGSSAVIILGRALDGSGALEQLVAITTLLALFFAAAETVHRVAVDIQ